MSDAMRKWRRDGYWLIGYGVVNYAVCVFGAYAVPFWWAKAILLFCATVFAIGGGIKFGAIRMSDRLTVARLNWSK